MAATVTIFNKFKLGQINGDHFVAFGTDTFTVSLHTSAYTPDIDADEFYDDITWTELPTAGNYTAGGQNLAGTSVGLDTGSDFVYFDATDLTWAGLTATFRYAVLRKNTGTAGTSPLIQFIDFGVDQEPAGVDFVMQWAAAAAGAILKAA
jgi:hypothetical protein